MSVISAKTAYGTYQHYLKRDVARELARINLTLATYTEKMWSGNLHNLLHFLGLRMDAHAQWEIRQYANIIGNEIVKPLFPLTWEAFEDYRLNAMNLSALEISVIEELQAALLSDARIKGDAEKILNRIENKRERDECHAKLVRLGILEKSDVS